MLVFRKLDQHQNGLPFSQIQQKSVILILLLPNKQMELKEG